VAKLSKSRIPLCLAAFTTDDVQPSCSRHGDFTTVNENEMSLSNAAGKASIENEAQFIQEL
jgi:hypothetical protein